ncbi:polysaccharide deacetylase family protein [Marilutibacter alkalisoli]|uniref:Polysaccharide deacetylase family protein n=1 Tax=Marilutibacter alkalisoli TaxID=2591633 RepID=A0A514BQS7_9GAMM|nr:polysaccharide deacetylase family protein [Lysobacter alkalisoli]QDH69752.1 polysaccharide deacetylase family protein [Lysobacter alkalisoli]
MLPVLMYHGLHADTGAPGRFDPVYSVHPDNFARQLDWLCKSGYRSVRFNDLADGGVDGTACGRRVVITFDDGDVSNVEIALPLLLERDMVAEFFITSDFVGEPGMLDIDDVRTLARHGMGIGSHGRSHRFLEDLDADAMELELRESRARLEAWSGQRVDALALPGGRGGRRELVVAAALGYRHLLGSVPGPNRHPGGGWIERIAVTRKLSDAHFRQLVRWQGMTPWVVLARHLALSIPKRLLGNAGYDTLRQRLLRQRPLRERLP